MTTLPIPSVDEQLQLISDCATYNMRTVFVDAELLTDLSEIRNLNDDEFVAELVKAKEYDSEGEYLRYADLTVNNKDLCGGWEVPCLELVGYSDYSGNTHDQSNYEVFEEFLVENNLPYWQANGGHGTVALIVNWVALQNEELQEMIGSLEDHPVLDEEKLSELETEAFEKQIDNYDYDLAKGFEEWFEIEDLDEYVEKFYPFAYERGDYATEIFVRYDSGYNGGNPYHCFETGGQMYLDVDQFFNDIEKEDFDEILETLNEEQRLKETNTTQLKLKV